MTITRAERIREASRQRRQQRRENMQNMIHEEATRQLSERGDEGFSLREVAEGIGYAPTTIYRYFRDKDDLIFSLFETAFQSFSAALDSARQKHTHPTEQLEAIGRAYVQFALDHPVQYRLLFMERGDLLSRLYERLKLAGNAYVGPMIVEEVVISGQNQGLFPPEVNPQYVASFLWAQVHGIASLGISCPDMFPTTVIEASLCSLPKTF